MEKSLKAVLLVVILLAVIASAILILHFRKSGDDESAKSSAVGDSEFNNPFKYDSRYVIYAEPDWTLLPGIYDSIDEKIHTSLYGKDYIIEVDKNQIVDVKSGQSYDLEKGKYNDFVFTLSSVVHHLGKISTWAWAVGFDKLYDKFGKSILTSQDYIMYYSLNNNIALTGPIDMSKQVVRSSLFGNSVLIDQKKNVVTDKNGSYPLIKYISIVGLKLPWFYFIYGKFGINLAPVSYWLIQSGAINLFNCN